MKRSPFWFAEPDIAIDNSHAFAWELDGALFSHLVEFDSRTLTSDLAPYNRVRSASSGLFRK